MNVAFFDSNIIVYAADPRPENASKNVRARELMQSRVMKISTQVLMETFDVLVKRRLATRIRATEIVSNLADNDVMSVEPDDVLRAIDTASQYQLSHWDGLILRAAEKARAGILYTEDLRHGQAYGSVRACNPFIEDFLAVS